jgi:hypothetical protein
LPALKAASPLLNLEWIVSLRAQTTEHMNQNHPGSNQVLKPSTGAEELATQSVAVQPWQFTRGLPRWGWCRCYISCIMCRRHPQTLPITTLTHPTLPTKKIIYNYPRRFDFRQVLRSGRSSVAPVLTPRTEVYVQKFPTPPSAHALLSVRAVSRHAHHRYNGYKPIP